jgi:OOP family OmpA-OmpF porin
VQLFKKVSLMKKLLSLCAVLVLISPDLDARNRYDDTGYMTFKYGLTTVEDGFSLDQHSFSFDIIGNLGYEIKPKLDFTYVSIDEKFGVDSLFQTAINGYYEPDYNYQNIVPYVYAGLGYEYVSGSREMFDSNFYIQEAFGLEIPISQPSDDLHIVTELRLMQLIGSEEGQDDEITIFLGLRLPIGNAFSYTGRSNRYAAPMATYAELADELPEREEKVQETNYSISTVDATVTDTYPVKQHNLFADEDGDGVADDKDICPNTKRYAAVNDVGCPIRDDRRYIEEKVYADTTDGFDNSSYSHVDVDNRGAPIASSSAVSSKFRALPFTRKILDIHFKLNSSEVAAESRAVIRKFVSAVNNTHFTKIVVEGYTDSTGGYEKNMILSQRRADSVKDIMIQYGVDSSRIRAVGKGELSPISPNDTEIGRAENRRIEVIVE